MLYIAYRGLFNGEDTSAENTPKQIQDAIYNHFDVMVDLWRVDNILYLGSEEPTTEVSEKYMQNKLFWINCRNDDALTWISSQKAGLYPKYLQAQPHSVVTTNNGYLWTPPNLPLQENSIWEIPEYIDESLYSTVKVRCYGMCSRFIMFVRRIRGDDTGAFRWQY